MGKQFDFYLQQVVEEIKKKYRPEKIILFGSAVSGKTRKWSDADLVIIKKTKQPFYERIGKVSSLIEHKIPLDILVYTPEEFQKMATWNYFIKEEVIKKGRVLYESEK